ncbi:DMT family transporter [Dyella agri]|uniref:DMT family transporter n=1 Tax=Dyella agri TaxID=1926869 RepID=A0ABW8KD05_9GAMM
MTTTSPQRSARLCLALAMLTVGSTVVAGKLVVDGLPPFLATALRFALATPLLALATQLGGVRWPRLDARTLGLLVVQAAAGSTGYTVFLLAGLKLTPAADAGVLLGALPAAVGVLSVLLLREHLRPRNLLAIALATIGVLLTALQAGTGLPSARALLGDALVLAAVACEALFLLLNKRLRTPIAPLAQATLMSGFGLLLALPPALLELAGQPAPAWSPTALLAVAWYALGPTAIGYWLWYRGAARLSGVQAAPFTALAPPTALLLSALLLGERLHAAQWAGTALVVAAVLVNVIRVAPEPDDAAETAARIIAPATCPASGRRGRASRG